jgi:peptide/nickel transport system ATP-binding protein
VSAALLEVRDLRVELKRGRQQLVALDGISFEIAPGEVLGVVGESGAGKSLTGAAIIDLLVPPLRRTGGEIVLSGRHLDALSREDMRKVRGRRIGFIAQDPMTSLNPVITIGQQLVDTITTHLPVTKEEARERAIRWIGRVGLSDPARRLDQYPHQLSGGMRQRVVIALALCAEPELVIADEPTTALDVSVQAHVLQVLRDLHEETGVAVMLITHDLGVIAKMADRVAVLYAGRVAEIGPTGEVLRTPRHPYTSGLMRATVAPGLDRKALDPIPGSMPNLSSIPAGCAFNPRCARATAECRTQRPPLAAYRNGVMGMQACFHPLEEGR